VHKLKALTMIQLKDFIGKYTSGLGMKNKYIGRILLLVLAGLLAVPSITLSIVIYDSLQIIGQTELLITSMYLNSVIFMFIFGFPFIISVFFFARDSHFLAALPIREDSLIISKLATVYIYLLVVSTLILGPALLIYLINSGFSIYLLILSLMTLILAPLLPLMISSIIILPFGNIFSRSSHRKMLVTLFNIIFLVGILGFQLFFGNYFEDPEMVQELLAGGGFIEIIGMNFPPSIWLTRAFTGSLISVGLFLALNLLLIFILKFTAKLFFRRSLLAFAQEGGSSNGRIYFKKRSRSFQLIRRNILIILKEPMFLMNNGIVLIAPIFIIAILLIQGDYSLAMLGSAEMESYWLLILSVFIASPALMGNITATAITREGQSFWETRVMPISAAENLKYRILTTIILSSFSSLLFLVMALFIIPFSLELYGLAALFSLVLTLLLAYVDIVINIFRPHLNWTNPTAAVKNNLNVVFSLLIRAGIGLVFFLFYQIFPGLFVGSNQLVFISTIIFAGLYILVRTYVYRQGAEKFEKISI